MNITFWTNGVKISLNNLKSWEQAKEYMKLYQQADVVIQSPTAIARPDYSNETVKTAANSITLKVS